jgi:chemotaxis protein MotB
MVVIGVAAVVGCSGVSKEQYGQTEAEAAKYKAAAADASSNVTALETKVKSLEQQNAALTTQKSELEEKLVGTGAAKTELETKMPVRLNERLLFQEKSSKLTPEAKRSLDSMGSALEQMKDMSIIVAGHTDDSESGGKTGQIKRWQLSTARALEVAKYLVGRGVDSTRVGVAGFGQGRPVAPNDSLANKALNRRVEIALAPTNVVLQTLEVKPATLK